MGVPPGNSDPYGPHGQPDDQGRQFGGSYQPSYYTGPHNVGQPGQPNQQPTGPQPNEPYLAGPNAKRTRRPRVALAAAAVAGLVVGAGVATGVTLAVHGRDSAQPTPPQTSSTGRPSTPVSGAGADCTQPVHANDMNADYSVPCGWKVNKSDTSLGFVDKSGATAASVVDSTEYQEVKCTADFGGANGLGPSTTFHALTGVEFAKGQTDPHKAAEKAVTTWAGEYNAFDGTAPTVHLVQSQPTTVGGSDDPAWMSSALLLTKPGKTKPRKGATCPPNPPAAVVTVVAVHATKAPNNPDNCALLVITADEKTPNAMPASTIDAIASSLHLR